MMYAEPGGRLTLAVLAKSRRASPRRRPFLPRQLPSHLGGGLKSSKKQNKNNIQRSLFQPNTPIANALVSPGLEDVVHQVCGGLKSPPGIGGRRWLEGCFPVAIRIDRLSSTTVRADHTCVCTKESASAFASQSATNALHSAILGCDFFFWGGGGA